jgi:hypothetical protein
MGALLTSDYVYADSFANQANNALDQVGASGVPTSQFLRPSDIDLVTPSGIGLALQRLHPGSVKGLHGTQLHSVVALPNGPTLQPGPTNQVSGKNLVFEATIKDSGHFREVNVTVRLTLKRLNSGAPPITKTAQIPSIDANATATARFPGLFASAQTAPDYSVPYKLTVTALRVPGERNLQNNTASYTVEFKIS